MAEQLVNEFTVNRPIDEAWAVITDVELPMPGRHNVQNALAAIGVAAEMGVADDVIQRGFASFGGVKRRFRASSRTCRSTALPRSASTTPRSRRCSAGSPIGA